MGFDGGLMWFFMVFRTVFQKGALWSTVCEREVIVFFGKSTTNGQFASIYNEYVSLPGVSLCVCLICVFSGLPVC